jgi:energy-coupling factor transport system ATP-binding protein
MAALLLALRVAFTAPAVFCFVGKKMADPIIRLENVEYTYACLEPSRRAASSTHPTPALKEVTLAVEAGEYLAVIGHNGSGKSTLARLLNGLLRPTAGRVLVDGRDTRHPAHTLQIRRTVGLVFQDPDNQIVATVVEEDVAFGPENLGVPEGELQERVSWALGLLDLLPYRHRAPHLLSAGQKQRLAVAGVMAMRPRVLVLDEATAMLDPAGRRELLAALRNLHAQGVTVVLITHFMGEAAEADRVVVLEKGRIALEGTPRQVFTEAESLQQLGLDLPPAARLAWAIHEKYPPFPTNRITMAEVLEAILAACRGRTIGVVGATAPPPAGGNHPEDRVRNTKRPLVQVQGLHHIYLRGTPLETTALRGVDLEVGRGQAAGIMGPTGSGKSTLLQFLNALLTPQAGRVLLDGQDLSDPKTDRQAARFRVGLLFQHPGDQLFERYVGDDVAFGPRAMGMPREEVRERVRRAMEAVGLPFEQFKDRLTTTLSGGERHKAALAGVLALEPEVLALDEPTAGLDPRSRRDLLSLLHHWRKEQHGTLVVATHNMEDLAELAERTYLLADGKVTLGGPTRQVFARGKELTRHGLSTPQAAAVVQALRARGLPLPAHALTIPEAADEIAALLRHRPLC